MNDSDHPKDPYQPPDVEDWIWLRFKHSIQALALPADEQLAYFPDFVCKADELALNFDGANVLRYTSEYFTEQQCSLLKDIDSQFDLMSAQKNSGLWTDEALRENPLWERIREMAKELLKTFDWENEVPPNDYVYIGGKPTK
jgi:hypothetical protein